MTTELESLADVDAHLARVGSLRGCYVQSVDLRERSTALRGVDVTDAMFLGCLLSQTDRSYLVDAGALVFPALPDLPFDPYRPSLYTPDELFRELDHGYPATLDARVFAWMTAHLHPGELGAELAATLHDHAITEALEQRLAGIEPASIVGLLGGHAQARGSDAYRASAELAARLTASGRLVFSGGGPGAMEAANLGAAFPGAPDELDAIIDQLAAVPSWSDDVGAWAGSALAQVYSWPTARLTLGIPTWFYGHEPPNAFATGQAKYFNNAIREDALLRLCQGGLVFLPGAAGTVQEIFQAVTPSYYAKPGAVVPALILVGRDYWTSTLPAWPLLKALARGRSMADRVHLVDSVDEALAVLG